MEQLIIKQIETKNVLTKSNLPVSDYSVNPYVGCTHACKYCYASFMKRFTNHTEPWGDFRRKDMACNQKSAEICWQGTVLWLCYRPLQSAGRNLPAYPHITGAAARQRDYVKHTDQIRFGSSGS